MIIITKGNCEKCGCEFGQQDSLQSTNVECSMCKEVKKLCVRCKSKGCKCGGKYLDAWDKFPNIMH
jgi:hypothetical protein